MPNLEGAGGDAIFPSRLVSPARGRKNVICHLQEAPVQMI
jgi:hypothetical protein